VHDPLDVARDPHLHARGFFRARQDGVVATLPTPWPAAHAAEVEVGREVPPLRAGPFSLMDFVRWAGYQENWLRIHYDEAYAVGSARLPGVVQSGNHRTALMLRMVTDWLDSRGRVLKFTVRHTAPVHVGDELVCAGRISACSARDGGGLIVNLDVWATTGNGQRASEGTATVEVLG
jgi:acyl dehydratase